MKTFFITLAVLVVAGVGVYYLVFNNNSIGVPEETATATNDLNIGTPTRTPVPTATVTPTPTPKTSVSKTPTPTNVSVNIVNFAFSPSTLTIKKGTRVTWTNNDGVSHTVTSDTGSMLNSANLLPGQSFSFTFNSVGTTAYHCAIHPIMKGSVTVTN